MNNLNKNYLSTKNIRLIKLKKEGDGKTPAYKNWNIDLNVNWLKEKDFDDSLAWYGFPLFQGIKNCKHLILDVDFPKTKSNIDSSEETSFRNEIIKFCENNNLIWEYSYNNGLHIFFKIEGKKDYIQTKNVLNLTGWNNSAKHTLKLNNEISVDIFLELEKSGQYVKTKTETLNNYDNWTNVNHELIAKILEEQKNPTKNFTLKIARTIDIGLLISAIRVGLNKIKHLSDLNKDEVRIINSLIGFADGRYTGEPNAEIHYNDVLENATPFFKLIDKEYEQTGFEIFSALLKFRKDENKEKAHIENFHKYVDINKINKNIKTIAELILKDIKNTISSEKLGKEYEKTKKDKNNNLQVNKEINDFIDEYFIKNSNEKYFKLGTPETEKGKSRSNYLKQTPTKYHLMSYNNFKNTALLSFNKKYNELDPNKKAILAKSFENLYEHNQLKITPLKQISRNMFEYLNLKFNNEFLSLNLISRKIEKIGRTSFLEYQFKNIDKNIINSCFDSFYTEIDINLKEWLDEFKNKALKGKANYLKIFLSNLVPCLSQERFCVVLIGKTRIGKSSIFKFIKDCLGGDENCLNTDLENLRPSDFNKMDEAIKKWVVYINENENKGDSKSITKATILKRLIKGESFEVHKKGIDKYTSFSPAVAIIDCNENLNLSENSLNDGWDTRLLQLDFSNIKVGERIIKKDTLFYKDSWKSENKKKYNLITEQFFMLCLLAFKEYKNECEELGGKGEYWKLLKDNDINIIEKNLKDQKLPYKYLSELKNSLEENEIDGSWMEAKDGYIHLIKTEMWKNYKNYYIDIVGNSRNLKQADFYNEINNSEKEFGFRNNNERKYINQKKVEVIIYKKNEKK